MPSEKLALWERNYRKSAMLDGCMVLVDHLTLLDLDSEPDAFLEGTIKLVRMSAAYLTIDNRPVDKLLAMQGYNPAPNPEVLYIFTFDLCGKAFARAFAGLGENKMIDLADLFNSTWDEYQVAGYYEFFITRADQKPLLVKEIKSLIKIVKDDLYYDYSKDELDIEFNEGNKRMFLQVTLFEKP